MNICLAVRRVLWGYGDGVGRFAGFGSFRFLVYRYILPPTEPRASSAFALFSSLVHFDQQV